MARRSKAAVALMASSFLTILPPESVQAQTLDSLLRLQDLTAQRESRADPSGGNLDMRRVEAGQTFTSLAPDPKAKGQRLLLDRFQVIEVEVATSRPDAQEDSRP